MKKREFPSIYVTTIVAALLGTVLYFIATYYIYESPLNLFFKIIFFIISWVSYFIIGRNLSFN